MLRERGIQGQQLLSLSHIHLFQPPRNRNDFPIRNQKEKKKTRNVRARFERDKKKETSPRRLGRSLAGERWSDFASSLPHRPNMMKRAWPPPHASLRICFSNPTSHPPPSAKCQWVVRVSHSVPLSLVNHRPRDTRGKRGRGGRNGSR